jgi:hypothetical protein
MTVGAAYLIRQSFFSNREWNLLNWQYNPYRDDNGFNINARFRHRIGVNQRICYSGETTESLIRNISYTLHMDMKRVLQNSGDDRYKDDLFKYGYVGNLMLAGPASRPRHGYYETIRN